MAQPTSIGNVNVAEIRDTEAALHESEARLRLAVQAANVGLWDWDLQTNAVHFSPEWKSQIGHRKDEIADRFDEWQSRVHPDDLEPALKKVRAFLKNPLGRYESEFRLRHKDGSYRWINAQGDALPGGDGQPVRMLGSHIDVTGRKQAEEELRQLNAQLEQRVAERTAELEEANKELDAFAHSVSHDLRAPLRAVAGFGEFLTDECAPAFDERARDHLRRMMDATARMGALIDDLLQFARASRAELRRGPVDLSALAQQVARDLQEAGTGRRVQFFCAPGLRASGDARLLRVALVNLLGNAWKYTGKVTEPRVEFGRSGVNGEISYFARDNGAGFDMLYVDRLFGAFQRLHSAAEFEGTGVGLATVQRIIHRHGGKIWAEAKVNEGATFHFTLPEPPEPPPANP